MNLIIGLLLTAAFWGVFCGYYCTSRGLNFARGMLLGTLTGPFAAFAIRRMKLTTTERTRRVAKDWRPEL